ncbi:hypothetical protein [Humisphaera borealis]|uniref:Uncharacterized protein n=1 Tax=Humisphaera borealis TaxID=2807512 RepID=A0A7M2X0P9_9BACT|nr:hypothetical protein [Humisphaera borealis]QOV90310.1 hypothetical protein IPV69_02765 [Humisphaera borealis]
MDKKLFTIGVLSVSAVVLFAANLLQPRTAQAGLVVKDNDFTAVTARTAQGGEALYILDNRTGNMVVMNYDPNRRAVVPMTAPRSIMDAFKGGR